MLYFARIECSCPCSHFRALFIYGWFAVPWTLGLSLFILLDLFFESETSSNKRQEPSILCTFYLQSVDVPAWLRLRVTYLEMSECTPNWKIDHRKRLLCWFEKYPIFLDHSALKWYLQLQKFLIRPSLKGSMLCTILSFSIYKNLRWRTKAEALKCAHRESAIACICCLQS